MSRDLFDRVEGQGQSLVETAKVMGLGLKDCAYLLAGFRRDMAAELVALLVAAEIPHPVIEEVRRSTPGGLYHRVPTVSNGFHHRGLSHE